MNKKSITLLFLVAIILLGGLLWLGNKNISNNINPIQPIAGLDAKETAFDFGSISMANGKVSHQFEVTNHSTQKINIKQVYTSCMCTEANLLSGSNSFGPFGMEGMGVTTTNIVLEPNTSIEAEAIFDPAAHGPAGVGQIERIIYLVDDAGHQLQLEIKANVTP